MQSSATPESVQRYFQTQTVAKESHTTAADHLTNFDNGIAPYNTGLRPFVDAYGEKLIPNYSQDITLPTGVVLPAMIGGRQRTFTEQFHEQRDRKPIVVLAPHPSLATPYLIARFLNQPYQNEVSEKLYSVVGPRPMLFDYKIDTEESDEPEIISPYALGTALGNLLLTGTNTTSTDDAPEEVRAWLKEQASTFKQNVEELMEPQEHRDNNVLIICPSGKIAFDRHGILTEFLPRNYASYIDLLRDRAVFWTIGVYDHVLRDTTSPESHVFINPSPAAQSITPGVKSNDAGFTLHQEAVSLSSGELGGMQMQTFIDARGRRFGSKVLDFSRQFRQRLF